MISKMKIRFPSGKNAIFMLMASLLFLMLPLIQGCLPMHHSFWHPHNEYSNGMRSNTQSWRHQSRHTHLHHDKTYKDNSNTQHKEYSENNSEEKEAIKNVIKEAYVEGVHIEKDVEKMKKGFHPIFNLFSLKDNEVKITTIKEWEKRVKISKAENPNRRTSVEYNFPMINITGNTAVARTEIYNNSKHIFTDYISLYKFDDGWKIVAKLYYRHPK